MHMHSCARPCITSAPLWTPVYTYGQQDRDRRQVARYWSETSLVLIVHSLSFQPKCGAAVGRPDV